MGDNPLKVYRYRNLKLAIWKDKGDGKPTVSISRGFKPSGCMNFVNVSVALYHDNLPELRCLIDRCLNEYPVGGE